MADRKISFELVQRGKQIYKQGGVRHVRILGPVFYADVESNGVYRVTITKNNGGSIANFTCDCIEGKQRSMCEHVAALDYYLSHKKNEINDFKELIDYVNKRYSRYGFNRGMVDESTRVLNQYYESDSDMNDFFQFVQSYCLNNYLVERYVRGQVEKRIFDLFHYLCKHRLDEFIEASKEFYISCVTIRESLLDMYEIYAKKEHLVMIVDILNDVRLKDKLPLLNFIMMFPRANRKMILDLLSNYEGVGIYQLYLAEYEAENGHMDKAMDALEKVVDKGLNREQEKLYHNLQLSLSKTLGKGELYLSYLKDAVSRNVDYDDLMGLLTEARELFPEDYKKSSNDLYKLIEKSNGSRLTGRILNDLKDINYIYLWIDRHLNLEMLEIVKSALYEYDPVVFVNLFIECMLGEYNQRRGYYGVHSFKHFIYNLEDFGFNKEQLFELCERLMEMSDPEFDLYNFCKEMESELIDELVYH